MSFPEGSSVNDGIDPSTCSLSYFSVHDAARDVFRQGQHSLMAKVDVKSAYQNIPVHPDDRWLLSMQWEVHCMWILPYHSALSQRQKLRQLQIRLNGS